MVSSSNLYVYSFLITHNKEFSHRRIISFTLPTNNFDFHINISRPNISSIQKYFKFHSRGIFFVVLAHICKTLVTNANVHQRCSPYSETGGGVQLLLHTQSVRIIVLSVMCKCSLLSGWPTSNLFLLVLRDAFEWMLSFLCTEYIPLRFIIHRQL